MDACDVGWGACAYQMKEPWIGPPEEEGRMRVGDTGERLIIMWISKGWTTHELQLPVFYREALARLLALEKFRNLIETNIEAGITLYTDHKPALFENSLFNKGQLSAWKLAEVSDLLSIVENLYRQGGKMLFADPLSRVCGPTEGWHDPSIPCKIAILLKHLPESIRETPKIRLYAGKETSGASKILHQWRKAKNLLASSIAQGKLSTSGDSSVAFHIGIEDVNKVVDLCMMLIKEGKQFAILISTSIVGEIARLENNDSERNYDSELISSVEKLSKIILAQDAEMWLISLDKHHIDEFVSLQKQMEANLQELTIVKEAVLKVFFFARGSKVNKVIREAAESYYHDDNLSDQDDEGQENIFTHIMLPSTRSMAKRTKNFKGRSSGTMPNSEDQTPSGKEDSIPVISEGRIKWKRIPREPIPQLSDINLWVGQQLRHTNMPAKYLNVQPKGDLIPMDSTYPEGLLAVPNAEGQPRIIVPPAEMKALILQTH